MSLRHFILVLLVTSTTVNATARLSPAPEEEDETDEARTSAEDRQSLIVNIPQPTTMQRHPTQHTDLAEAVQPRASIAHTGHDCDYTEATLSLCCLCWSSLCCLWMNDPLG